MPSSLLVKQGYADFVVTEDLDILAHIYMCGMDVVSCLTYP